MGYRNIRVYRTRRRRRGPHRAAHRPPPPARHPTAHCRTRRGAICFSQNLRLFRFTSADWHPLVNSPGRKTHMRLAERRTSRLACAIAPLDGDAPPAIGALRSRIPHLVSRNNALSSKPAPRPATSSRNAQRVVDRGLTGAAVVLCETRERRCTSPRWSLTAALLKQYRERHSM